MKLASWMKHAGTQHGHAKIINQEIDILMGSNVV